MRIVTTEAGDAPPVHQALHKVVALHPILVSGAIGKMRERRFADLVLLDGNPLERIENTNRIRAVVVAGKLLRRSDLDRLLRLGEEMASRN